MCVFKGTSQLMAAVHLPYFLTTVPYLPFAMRMEPQVGDLLLMAFRLPLVWNAGLQGFRLSPARLLALATVMQLRARRCKSVLFRRQAASVAATASAMFLREPTPLS